MERICRMDVPMNVVGVASGAGLEGSESLRG
jgi:hypothetical protein